VRERRGTTPLAHMTYAAHFGRWRAHPFGSTELDSAVLPKAPRWWPDRHLISPSL